MAMAVFLGPVADNRASWTPAKTPRVEVFPVIHSGHWKERFDAPTEPVFAGGAPGAAEQGRRPAGGDPVPDLYPRRTRDLALHRPGLTPADEANSAGVMNPRDV